MDDKSAPVDGSGLLPAGGGPGLNANVGGGGAVAGSSAGAGPAGTERGAPESFSSFPPTVRRRVALTLEETGPLWDSFRAGKVVRCPCDDGSIALSVDGASAYRLVCTQCGTASSWFEVVPAGLRDRTTPQPVDEDPTDD